MGQISNDELTVDEVRAILDGIKADYEKEKEREEMERTDRKKIEMKEKVRIRKRYYTLDERIEDAKRRSGIDDSF